MGSWFCATGRPHRCRARRRHREGTTAYQSPWRCRNTELPLCKQDDLYALGVSIWHIWQDPEKHQYLDEDITDGLQPNLFEG